jgi:hypothetical protein
MKEPLLPLTTAIILLVFMGITPAYAESSYYFTLDCTNNSCELKFWERGWLSNDEKESTLLRKQRDGSFTGTGQGGTSLGFHPRGTKNPYDNDLSRSPENVVGLISIRTKSGLKEPAVCGFNDQGYDYVCIPPK